ncbi:hypothetical protein HGM15179_020605 [Zosterops borbonicus]|uniref:Ig-like domain-containing protein n=1 Tax=Zosterops borbonicus TaxID=364589 RepID=A0A8K1FWW0_9PASS|nr:hypothetical protein HGM15179_020605 [Zosterops borbonicus]
MEEFWIQLLALLTLLTQTCSASDTTELIGAVGGSVTFRSPSTDTQPALWSFGNESIVIMEFWDPPRPIFYQDKFKTRFTVSERGRALSISQLRMEDAGTYSVTIGRRKFTFILLVYRELTEPTVSCEAQDCLDKVCLFSLRCSVTGAGFGNVSYTWRGWGQRWEERPVVLTVVDKSSLDNLEPLRCTARNAVSTRSVTVTTPEGLCPGAPLGTRARIGVIAGVAVMVVILLVFLVFFCKSKGSGPARTARTARLASGSAEISTTALLGRQDSPQAVRCLGPVPGPALDQFRSGLRRTLSAPAQITDLLRPEPGPVLDKSRPGLRRTFSEPAQITDQLGPEPGPALDKSRPGS